MNSMSFQHLSNPSRLITAAVTDQISIAQMKT